MWCLCRDVIYALNIFGGAPPGASPLLYHSCEGQPRNSVGSNRYEGSNRIEVHGRLRAVIEQAPAEGLTKLRAVRRVVSSP